jgi:hypothetical protein
MLWSALVCVVVCVATVYAANEYGYYNGDKQLNNIVSIALSSLAATSAIDNIERFYDQATFSDVVLVSDAVSCARPMPYFPVGTLKDVLDRGTLRICLDESEKVCFLYFFCLSVLWFLEWRKLKWRGSSGGNKMIKYFLIFL